MYRYIPLLIILIFYSLAGKAQDAAVKAVLLDANEKTPVSAATISIYLQKDSSKIKSTVADSKGGFLLTGLPRDSFFIEISSVGYEKLSQRLLVDGIIKDMGTISLLKQGKDLSAVTVVGKTPPVQQKGDTVQYSASQYKVNPDATAEELIKKMPGVTVDKAGTVTAQGEQVKKVTVDGRDFFGDDATAALRNLPAEVIDKIQVFDKLSDQAAFTGFDDGNSSKAINIITKSTMRNGQYGRVYAGYGTNDRYAAGGNVSFLKENRRISLVGLFNNVNQQNFSSQDLLGVTSSSGGPGNNRGGGSRGGRGNNNNSSDNFLVGQQNGINSTNSFGINYADAWSKKLQVTGSYFFNNSNTSNNQLSNTRYFLNNGSDQYNDENTVSTSKNYNHRINLKLEYKIDAANSLIITPSLSFQKNNSFNGNDASNYVTVTDPVSDSRSNVNKNTSGYNINNSILFRHSFAKKGRTISVNLNTGFNNKEGEAYQQSYNTYYKTGSNIDDSLQQFTGQETRGHQLSANFVYTEPVGKKGQLQFNYSPSLSKSKADQHVYQYDYLVNKYSDFDTSLSNKFDNTISTHTIGTTFRLGDKDNMFAAGVSYQYSRLHSDQVFPLAATVSKSFNNILPNLMWRKKISAKSNLRIMYRSSTNAPSVSQLQNVYNNSNPLYITTGNENLRQQTGNTVSARYTYTNTGKGKSFFANLFFQQNNNYISNATYIATQDSALTPTVILYKGSQLSKPVNVDGYFSLRSFLTYGMPVKFIRSNINFNGGFTWARTPGVINAVSSISKSYNYNAGVVVASNINERVDFNVSYAANFNVVKNSVQPQLNNNFVTQSAGLQVNLLSKNGWFIQNDVSNQSYTGLSGGFNQSYWLWNMGAGKKILKNQAGEVKLSVFDLLKQNRSINRSITETYIEDVQNLVLQQYFMLTFTYKLKNFGSVKMTPENGPGMQGKKAKGTSDPSF